MHSQILWPSACPIVWEIKKWCSRNIVDGKYKHKYPQQMGKEKDLGKISFKTDGSLDKNKVINIYCRCELSYH